MKNVDGVRFSVFTKPWRELPLERLGELVRGMGFEAIEYPLRKGYQVEPAEGSRGIKRLCGAMAESGVSVDPTRRN